MSATDDDRDWSEVPCRIEACPRAWPTFDFEQECALLTVHRRRGGTAADVPIGPPECGSVASIDKWEAMGLFDVSESGGRNMLADNGLRP